MKWLRFLFLPLTQAIIKGISLGSGLETNNRALDCYWSHPPEYYIPLLHDIGFNSLRVPFSAEYVREGDFHIMDQIFELAQEHEMTVLLDLHRWYNNYQGNVDEFNRDDLKHVWITILNRYKDREALTSVGIWNEYQNDDVNFWNGYLRDVITTLEDKYPNRFIYYASGVRWAGSLHGMDLEDLPFKDRIRYEWHKYRFSSGYDWRKDWDWSTESGLPKDRIVAGEFGWKSDNDYDVQWANAFVDYLIEKDIRDTYFWMAWISSGDTGGIGLDCNRVDWRKVEILKRLWGESNRYLRSIKIKQEEKGFRKEIKNGRMLQ